MGGYGSGRWGWHRRRATVGEAALSLGAAQLAGGRVGPPVACRGSCAWTNRDGSRYAEVGVELRPDARWAGDPGWVALVSWNAGGPDRRNWLRLEPVALTYGRRWFLVCPRCGRRRARLYLPRADWPAFQCRVCARLAYHSQRLAPNDRLFHRARVLTRRLGADFDATAGYPPKPPRMHWRTYERRLDQLEAVEHQRSALFCAAVAGLLRRIDRRSHD